MSSSISISHMLDEQKILTISLQHIPESDQELLKRLISPETACDRVDRPHWWFASSTEAFTAYPVYGGWLLHLHDPLSVEGGASLLFSEFFYTVLRWAVRRSAAWLRLDDDGAVNPNLQIYFS